MTDIALLLSHLPLILLRSYTAMEARAQEVHIASFSTENLGSWNAEQDKVKNWRQTKKNPKHKQKNNYKNVVYLEGDHASKMKNYIEFHLFNDRSDISNASTNQV